MWADKDQELARLMRTLNTPPYELVYWVGYPGMEVFNLPGVVFHSHSNAGRAQPALGVDTSSFAPPGEDIIKALHNVESLVLTMMNRALDRASVDERRHKYYDMLRYWLGVFEKYKPEMIIFSVEPHSVYDYLVYEIAKYFSIRTLCFNETRVSDRLLFMNDFREGSRRLLQEIEKNRGHDFTLQDLSPDLRKYYTKRTISEPNKTPSYVGFLNNKYALVHRLSLEKIWRSLLEGILLRKTYNFLFVEKNLGLIMRSFVMLTYRFRPNLKREYERLQVTPEMNRKFVYAALQVQPERSTSPMGDMFVDQILMLETLASSLPKDWIIYAKEHPLQWARIGINYSSSRYRGYYERIAKIQNVQLIPVNTNSYVLMEKAQAVVTVAGSPGWEAILHSKPAIVFGYPWYKDCPGIFKVNDVASCSTALAKIAGDFRVEQRHVINYLKSLDNATIHGYFAVSNEKASQLTRQENMKSIMSAIRAELGRVSAASTHLSKSI